MCLIHETKFATPPSPGHNSTSRHEGGLLTLVKEGMFFKRTAEGYSPPLEGPTIQIQLSHQRWTRIHNLYAVPGKGNTLHYALALKNTCVVPFAPSVGDIKAFGRMSASRPVRCGSCRLAHFQKPQYP